MPQPLEISFGVCLSINYHLYPHNSIYNLFTIEPSKIFILYTINHNIKLTKTKLTKTM